MTNSKKFAAMISLATVMSPCNGFVCKGGSGHHHWLSLHHPRNREAVLYATESSAEQEDQRRKRIYRSGSLRAATAEQGRVPYGESSRKYRRTIYKPNDWVQHRSEDRLVQNLKGIFYSGIVRQLQKEVMLIMSIATGVLLWNQVLVGELFHSLPEMSLPSLPFTLSSPALGLLLVFRTNASYGRWMEARSIWSRIISHCRNVVRMAATFTSKDAKLDRLCQSVWLLSRSIMNSLSDDDNERCYQKELKDMVGDNDDALVTKMMQSPDRAMSALMEVSLVLDGVPIDEKRRVEIDKSLVIIGDCLASCERIYQQPVPLVYTRHTARFLSFWMILLPLGLYDTIHSWILVPTMGILALFLFGIEELSVQLEEPFSILPMQHYCDGIKEQTSRMTDWSSQFKTATKTNGSTPDQ